jgi:DNA-binding beta-propeller fold protein YncE
MSPEGEIQQLRFVAGGVGGATLHAPRGMAITGDTLWVADVDGVAGFNRRTGASVGTITFPGETLGFLNDVAAGPDGTLYVTDTGTNRVYRVSGRTARLLVSDSTLGGPNGVAWDAGGARLLVVPYGGGSEVRAIDPATGATTVAFTVGAAQMDGVELLPGERVLVASQSDSSLHLVQAGRDRRLLRTAGKPADIGVDTRRNRVAVPYIALNRVDVWALPGRP